MLNYSLTQQPQGVVAFDDRYKVVHTLLPTVLVDPATKKPYQFQANTAKGVGQSGKTFLGTSTSGSTRITVGGGSSTCGYFVGNSKPVTVIVRFKLSNLGINQVIFSDMDTGGYGSLEFFVNSGNNISCGYRDSGGTGRAITVVALENNLEWHTLMLVHNPLTGLFGYIDGKLFGSNTANLGNRYASTGDPSWLAFGSYTTPLYNSTAQIALGAVLNGDFSSDAKSLTLNPWRIFKSPESRSWVPAVVGGGIIYTLSPGGTVSFTGTSPELREKMLAPSGSFVLSGSSSFLREHVYLPSGTVSFSGIAPLSQAATYVLSISGSVVFSGSIEYQRIRVQSASGTISFTGTFPPLHEKTYAPSGTISFSGAATENRIRVLSPTGEITFLGSAPIINPNVPAGQGTWRTLTGMGQ